MTLEALLKVQEEHRSQNYAELREQKSYYVFIWEVMVKLKVKVKVKVKVILVQALRLCTGRTAYRGSRGIALPFHDHGTRRG